MNRDPGGALRYLEATIAQARIKQDGKATIETTGNWIIARFNHDTSRELDPQLHTHAVVINATRRADGEWRALSSQEMFRAKMLGGAIYRAELARGLQRLGYDVEVNHRDGRFEVKTFTREQLRHFSRRREEIEAALEKVGATGAKASATLALYTRARKGPIDCAGLRGPLSSTSALNSDSSCSSPPCSIVAVGRRIRFPLPAWRCRVPPCVGSIAAFWVFSTALFQRPSAQPAFKLPYAVSGAPRTARSRVPDERRWGRSRETSLPGPRPVLLPSERRAASRFSSSRGQVQD